MSIIRSATRFQKKLFFTATGLMLSHFLAGVMLFVASSFDAEILGYICIIAIWLIPFLLCPGLAIVALVNAAAHARYRRWGNACLSILIALWGIAIEIGVFILFPVFPGMTV